MNSNFPNKFIEANRRVSKETLIQMVCGILNSSNKITDKNVIANKIIERELIADTRINENCAMPHCLCTQVVHSQVLIADCVGWELDWTGKQDYINQVIFILIKANESIDVLKKIKEFVQTVVDCPYEIPKDSEIEIIN